MARQTGRENCKFRVIVIYCELMKKQKVTTKQIINLLQRRYGITVDRKTIYSDIAAINRIVPIMSIAGRNGGYVYWDVLGEEENDD